MTELEELDATAQAALVRNRDVTAIELVDAAIARAEARNPSLNAIVHPRYERARHDALKAPDGPFCGVPIVVKDLDGPLAGEPYHMGTRLLRDAHYFADHDASLFAKLRAAGFVIIGKTNTPELGLMPTTEPASYGPTRNPWDLTRSPGGSSGGTGAAVAAGIVSLGHAGDGGGSIRIPASMCGLVGLKPSRGRVSLGPDEGQAWDGLVARHVLSRTVRDSAAVLDVLAGAMPGDPYTAPPPSAPFALSMRQPLGTLRIGLCTEAPARVCDVDPECVAATEAAARTLESLGHTVEPAWPDALAEADLLSTYLVVTATAVARDLSRIAAIVGRALVRDDMEPLTWSFAEMAAGFSAAAHAEAIDTMHAWSRRIAAWWLPEGGRGFDLLLTPTLAALPPLVGAVDGNHDEPGRTLAAAIPFGAFTVPWNITGQPAVSLPLGRTSGRPSGRTSGRAAVLPVGVQLVAAQGGEAVLLAVAAQLEAADPW